MRIWEHSIVPGPSVWVHRRSGLGFEATRQEQGVLQPADLRYTALMHDISSPLSSQQSFSTVSEPGRLYGAPKVGPWI